MSSCRVVFSSFYLFFVLFCCLLPPSILFVAYGFPSLVRSDVGMPIIDSYRSASCRTLRTMRKPVELASRYRVGISSIYNDSIRRYGLALPIDLPSRDSVSLSKSRFTF